MSEIATNGLSRDPQAQTRSLAAARSRQDGVSDSRYILLQTKDPLDKVQKTGWRSKGVTVCKFITDLVPLLFLTWATGCATQSRLGSLIPAHRLSNQRSGEEVWLHIARSDKAAAAILPALALPVATAAVGLAVDAVKGQLQREAQLYSAQFGQKLWLDTTDIDLSTGGKPANVLITRWVSSPTLSSKPRDYATAIASASNLITHAFASSTTRMDPSAFAERTKGKSLAFAYCVRIAPANHSMTNAPFTVRPRWKWQWLSKAKIVSLRSLNPLSWLAGVFLKTGSSVEYDVYLTIDSLINTRDGYPKMITVGIGDPIQGPERFYLSGSKQWTDYSAQDAPTFGWVAIPGYPGSHSQGYLSIQITVNESDPSNVKKIFLKGAEYLEANKKDIAKKIIEASD